MARRCELLGLVILVIALAMLGTSLAVDKETGADDEAGALFGAYVDPPIYTDDERIAAVKRFETDLGRRLTIVHSYHPWAETFPSKFDRYVVERGTTLMLSWAGTGTADILSGSHDALIRTRARAVRDLGAPILLRWRWEMNRPNLQAEVESPSAYVESWRRIRAIFAAEGADQVDWVWCPIGHGFTSTRAVDYYPGDAEVDWLCVDAYSSRADEPLEPHVADFLDWASRRPHPVMLGEFSTTRVPGGGDLVAWLRETRRFVKSNPQIAAVVFFEADKGESGPHAFSPDPAALRELARWSRDPWFTPAWDAFSPPRP
ncbi:hypothetical protein BJ980_003192 [Nocardioides daedukensis]|uniref:GH26 domain-containing protein n=1 Tax=Nocardioides daedukensis TaxID=634462 RepID=A0A7Y9UU88_9ACTN|nr:endoglucanase [Nocardioides daedukensis]NYG60269.1 hypothetical protein [Nocardioides daedukensis]